MGPWRWLAARTAAGPAGESPSATARAPVGEWSLLAQYGVSGSSFSTFSGTGALPSKRPRSALTPSEPQRSGGETRGVLLDSGSAMSERPRNFENHRWMGDKRTMRVHDLDNVTEACGIEDIL